MDQEPISIRDPQPPVPLSGKYKDALPDKEHLPSADFVFINHLLKNYGITTEAEIHESQTLPEATKAFGRDEFFSAVSELREYGSILRESLDNGFPDIPEPTIQTPHWQHRYDVYSTADRQRPSSKRLRDLSYLFLHFPEVKNVYDQIQAEKMATALPEFTTNISSSLIETIPSLGEYFEKSLDLMTDGMRNVVNTYNPTQVDNLGWVIGYEELACLAPKDLRKELVVGQGNGTFISFLNQVVQEGIEKGEDLQSKVRQEFLPGKGLGHQSMKTALTDFANHIAPSLSQHGLDATRNVIQENILHVGRCPAVLRGRLPDGKLTKRPIAYEYAATIVNNIPPNLLERT